MAFDMVGPDPISEIDAQLNEAIHELVVSDDKPREVHVSRISALMDQRMALSRAPIYSQVEALLRKRL
jgi:hypothetical protein